MSDGPHNPTQAQVEEATVWLMRLREPSRRPVFRKFDRWLAADPAHEAAFARAERMMGLVGETARELAAREKRREGRSVFAGPRWRPQRKWMAIAASVALLIGVHAANPNWLVNLRADAVTGVGESRRVELPDGSVVTLNTDSAIRYAYEQGVRTVELDRGEAFFDVVHDVAKPFVVNSGDAHVLGTHFNVRRDGAGTHVAVTQGLVRLASAEGAVLLPGGASGMVASGRPMVERGVDAGAASAWKGGQAVYYSVPLSKVVDDLSRYRGGRVLMMAPVAGRRALSGIFDIRNPDKAIKTAAQTVDAKLLHLPGGIIVIY
jgi:transmembrane sensor